MPELAPIEKLFPRSFGAEVGSASRTKDFCSDASVRAPLAVAPVRRSFARIQSGISRSAPRSDFGNFERAMQLPAGTWPKAISVSGKPYALDVAHTELP